MSSSPRQTLQVEVIVASFAREVKARRPSDGVEERHGFAGA
jgi:hypothetical protein